MNRIYIITTSSGKHASLAKTDITSVFPNISDQNLALIVNSETHGYVTRTISLTRKQAKNNLRLWNAAYDSGIEIPDDGVVFGHVIIINNDEEGDD